MKKRRPDFLKKKKATNKTDNEPQKMPHASCMKTTIVSPLQTAFWQGLIIGVSCHTTLVI